MAQASKACAVRIFLYQGGHNQKSKLGHRCPHKSTIGDTNLTKNPVLFF